MHIYLHKNSHGDTVDSSRALHRTLELFNPFPEAPERYHSFS